MSWTRFLEQKQSDRRQQNLWRERRILQTAQQATIRFSESDQSLINFSSNDYLGMANHPEVAQGMQQAVAGWGSGSGASHLVSGHQTPHHELELELAEFVGAEKAVLFSTGYMANLAVPSAFLGRNDSIVQDKLNHASLLDGGALSNAKLKRYQHNSVHQAEVCLQQSEDARVMLSTDGVFSMDGDIAPLSELKILCDQYDALMLVDDAHGLGVMGQQGQGSLELYGLIGKDNLLLLGTLGKAFGSFGAFVAGDELLIEHLVQYARPYIYTTALPAAVAEASRLSLRLIQKESWRREKVLENVAYFKSGAQQLGLDLMSSDTPIQPLLVGDDRAATQLSEYLYKQGFYITAIRPPTVPVGSARLRITLSAEHQQQQLDKLLDCLGSAKVKRLIAPEVEV